MEDEQTLDVVDLEDRYVKKMDELAQAERRIFEDFGSWQRVRSRTHWPKGASHNWKAL